MTGAIYALQTIFVVMDLRLPGKIRAFGSPWNRLTSYTRRISLRFTIALWHL
jgi:hypothetical protein